MQAINLYRTNQRYPNFLYFLVFLYVALSPFYVFKSGLPQPADMIMALGLMMGLTLYVLGARLSLNMTSISLGIFGSIVVLVNVMHYVFIYDLRMILTALIVLYNIGVFALICILFERDPAWTRKVLRYGFVISIAIELLFTTVWASGLTREIGSFNNPNQLGYWALLTAACLWLLHDKPRYSLFDYTLLAVLGFIAATSLSKATLLTFPIIVGLYFFSAKTGAYIKLTVLGGLTVFCMSAAFFAPGWFSVVTDTEIVTSVVDRINNIGQEADDSLEGRGYGRLLSNPEYILLGAGEGGFDRFPPYRYLELHAALATILFSYGVMGFMFFSLSMYAVLRRAPISFWVLFITIMSHGFVHQNIRFTGFWVMLAILYAVKKENIRMRQ